MSEMKTDCTTHFGGGIYTKHTQSGLSFHLRFYPYYCRIHAAANIVVSPTALARARAPHHSPSRQRLPIISIQCCANNPRYQSIKPIVIFCNRPYLTGCNHLNSTVVWTALGLFITQTAFSKQWEYLCTVFNISFELLNHLPFLYKLNIVSTYLFVCVCVCVSTGFYV